jgi:pimeloyl-ACP methyl ester carboxylesterase
VNSFPFFRICAAIFFAASLCSSAQAPTIKPLDLKSLGEYAGVYSWGPDSFIYLQLWNELSGTPQLVAFDESGEVRTLFPSGHDDFFTGPGAAVSTSLESTIHFERNPHGEIVSLTWQRTGSASRVAQRVHTEIHDDVRFSNGEVRLAGTLIRPATGFRHPAIILVPASGAEDREYLLPFVHFLVRHGVAVLGYDKRGVGGSKGDWTTASFDDLAGDAAAAFEYLKNRPDIDHRRIGLLGLSQAGWIMPLTATRANGLAFLISVSGAGVSPAETTFDEARGEMIAAKMPPPAIQQIVGLMKLEYKFAQTGQDWDAYTAAREKLVARMGAAPKTFPATPDDPYWNSIRRFYFYDPAPALRRLRIPTLALFGGLDDNILAAKNRDAWDASLKAAGNLDYTLLIFPSADHLMLDAKVGNNAEMPSLQQFVPDYFSTVHGWLVKRVRGVD